MKVWTPLVYKYKYIIHLASSTLVGYNNVFESKDEVNSIELDFFREKKCEQKLSYDCFWYEKVAFLITYIDSHQKSSCLSEIYVGADNICSIKQWRDAKEGIYLEKTFFWSMNFSLFTHESAETEECFE